MTNTTNEARVQVTNAQPLIDQTIARDFWRDSTGAVADGQTDVTDSIRHAGNVGIGFEGDSTRNRLDVRDGANVGAVGVLSQNTQASAPGILNANGGSVVEAAVTAAAAVFRMFREGTSGVSWSSVTEWRVGKWFASINASPILELWMNTGGTNTPTVKVIHFRSDGRINTPGLPTFANEAAALAGGLATGDWYKTPAGVLQIKL